MYIYVYKRKLLGLRKTTNKNIATFPHAQQYSSLAVNPGEKRGEIEGKQKVRSAPAFSSLGNHVKRRGMK